MKYSYAGKARWFTLGRYGAPWTVEQARGEARRVLGMVADRLDPQGAKLAAERDRRQALLMSDFCDRYLDAARRGLVLTRFNRPKKASTIAIDVGRIERHIKPLIGDLPIKDVTPMVVRRLVHDITAGKTRTNLKTGARGRAIVRGGAGTAARVADLLSGIMAWAVEEGLIERNPVHGVKRYRGEARNRFLSMVEIGRLGAVLRSGLDASGKPINGMARTIVKLLLLTGCRAGEIEGLSWSEVDLEQHSLRLDDTKVGRSLRALGGEAVEVLENLPRLAGSSFVFSASRGNGHYRGSKREVRRIMTAAGIKDAGRHVLRHTFASAASDLGYSDATIAGLLGHKGRGVTSRYVHRPDSALLAAADRVASHLARCLDETRPDDSGC